MQTICHILGTLPDHKSRLEAIRRQINFLHGEEEEEQSLKDDNSVAAAIVKDHERLYDTMIQIFDEYLLSKSELDGRMKPLDITEAASHLE